MDNKTAASIDVAVRAQGGPYVPETFRDELAQRIWLATNPGDDFWSHQIAPLTRPDAQAECIADEVLDLLDSYGIETP